MDSQPRNPSGMFDPATLHTPYAKTKNPENEQGQT